MKLLKKGVKFILGPVFIILVGMPLLGNNGFAFYLFGTAFLLFLWFIPWEIAERRQSTPDKVYRKVVLENTASANSELEDLHFVSDTGFQPDFVVNYSPIVPSENFCSDSYVSGKYNGVYFEKAHVNDFDGNSEYSGTLYVIHLDVEDDIEPALGLKNSMYRVNQDNVCVYISDSDNPNSNQNVMEIIDGLK